MAKTDGTSSRDVPRLTDGEHDQQQEMSGSHRSEVTRRQLLGVAAGAAILTGLPRYAHAAEAKGEVPRRMLGSTGEKVSAIGLGGYHLGKKDLPEAESIRIIRTAIDNGIDFLDNCWDYNGGESEVRMGKGLQNNYRQRAFLMTKIDGRDKKTAAQQIEDSLRRLKTDRIDLLQFHEIIRTNDPDRIFAAGGAMEAALEARQAGKIRYIGFTGHKSPAMHLHMLETAAKNQFRFEAVQMPLNVMDAHYDSFEEKVLPVLVKSNIGVLGMKPMGDHFILETKTATPIQCLHYSMSLPTSVVITGCDSMKILEQALTAARTFRPMEPSEIKAILAKTAPAAKQGRYELYKTSHHFDGTYQNPQWLG
ncbi:MAG TPA: aldo/keto reductase [Myxococcaceae bacterium]|nr:aldo/keto reductase [Myxococcaceae bacterium]